MGAWAFTGIVLGFPLRKLLNSLHQIWGKSATHLVPRPNDEIWGGTFFSSFPSCKCSESRSVAHFRTKHWEFVQNLLHRTFPVVTLYNYKLHRQRAVVLTSGQCACGSACRVWFLCGCLSKFMFNCAKFNCSIVQSEMCREVLIGLTAHASCSCHTAILNCSVSHTVSHHTVCCHTQCVWWKLCWEHFLVNVRNFHVYSQIVFKDVLRSLFEQNQPKSS